MKKMKIKNKLYLILLSCILVLTFANCAYRSGRSHSSESKQGKERVSSSENTAERIVRIRKDNKERGRYNSKKLDGAEIFKRYSSAVFMVYTANDFQGYQGSGFFIDDEGLAVSNYHVFKGTNIGYEKIKVGDEILKVIDVICFSEYEDYILFRINCSGNNFFPIAKNKPTIGEKVYAIGSPRGFENTISEGIISQWQEDNLMQISVPIDHGSSGGALINEYGEVVGITSGTFYEGSQANLNYAWSIDVVKSHL